jgi:CBS domain-containing protein
MTAAGERSLFLSRVGDLVPRAPVTCGLSATAVEIARLLSREGVGSAVVLDAEARPAGIVTDRDLRRKVVEAGLDPSVTRAATIMSSPVASVRSAAFAFEALLEMTRRDIHHLVVIDDGRLLGVVSSNDFLRLQTTHPVFLAREIAAAVSLEALARLAGRTTPLVRRLLDEGGTPYDIGQIVAEVNDRIVVRVLELTERELAAVGAEAPVPCSWLVFGSEARREQTLRTDQDNGLVYVDPPAEQAAAAAAYYARLSEGVIRALVTVGFPPCPGAVMASNPKWCQPLSAWSANFRRWLGQPLAEEILAASIFFDLRPIGGDLDLGARLAQIIRAEAPGSHVFLAHLARDVADLRVPLTLFGNIATESSGPHRGTVDVKAAGSRQLVGAARLAALELGLPETNTVDRIRAAAGAGLYTPDEAREMTDAYQHLMRLRLAHQLAQIEAGVPPDNHVDPARLSHAEALLFRDALKTVRRVQDGLRARFLTDRMMV